MLRLLHTHPFFLLLFSIVLLGWGACVKVISLSDDINTSTKITVDASINGVNQCLDCEPATIENTACVVQLSQSIGYQNEIGLFQIAQQQIKDAKVTLTDGTQTEELLPTTIPHNYVYNNIPVKLYDKYLYISKQIKGQPGKTYTLTIVWNNNTYQASTTIPDLSSSKNLVKISYKPRQKTSADSVVELTIQTNDPTHVFNYNRLLTSLNEQIRDDYYKYNFGRIIGGGVVINDRLDNGRDVPDRQIRIGKNRDQFQCLAPNTNNDNKEALKGLPVACRDSVKIGDTLYISLAEIDKNAYEFLSTMEFAVNTVSNPISNPIKVINNVFCTSNPNIIALGGFVGHLLQTKKIIIK